MACSDRREKQRGKNREAKTERQKQRGKNREAKTLKVFGGAGVLEIVENDSGETYRGVYTVKFEEAVFVLHCFQKKSKRGIETPQADMNIIRSRLRAVESFIEELRNEKRTRH
jgi:phage-related protein